MTHTAYPVVEIEPPHDCGIVGWFAGADLVDSFAVPLPAARREDMRILAERAFGYPALWIRTLLFVRDRVMAVAGIKSTTEVGRTVGEGDRIGFFPILSASPDELVVGADDSHLDFRLSLLRGRAAEGGERIVATTVVRCHNRLGRVYLAAIMPFHRIIVRASLRRLTES
ncbi:DUF2867 domain-containing protein [soil metagenome]